MQAPTFYFKIPSPCIFFSFHRIGACAREVPSPGTIMWISVLIAWLRFANGVCSNKYMERVTTDAKKKDFPPLNYCSDFPGKAEVWILPLPLRKRACP